VLHQRFWSRRPVPRTTGIRHDRSGAFRLDEHHRRVGRRPVRVGIPWETWPRHVRCHRRTVRTRAGGMSTAGASTWMCRCWTARCPCCAIWAVLSHLCEVPEPRARGHVSIPTYRSFTCGDDIDVVITANTEKMWQSFVQSARASRAHRRSTLPDQRGSLPGTKRRSGRSWKPRSLRAIDRVVGALARGDIPSAPVNTVTVRLPTPRSGTGTWW